MVYGQEHVCTLRPYIRRTADDLLNDMIANACGKPFHLIEKLALPAPSYVSYSELRNPNIDADSTIADISSAYRSKTSSI